MKKFALVAPVLLVFIVMTIMSSCKTTQVPTIQVPTGPAVNYVNVSDSLIQAHNLTSERLNLITYVNGPKNVTIELKNIWYDAKDSIEDGVFNFFPITHRDSVIIKPGTPGRLIQFDSVRKRMKIGFEESDTVYLVFGIKDKDKAGKYVLLSEEGTNPPQTQYGRGNYYNISGKPYEIELFMVIKSDPQLDVKGRIAAGKKNKNPQQQKQPPVNSQSNQAPVDTNQQNTGTGLGPNDY